MAASGNFPLTPLGGYPAYETLPEDTTPIKEISPSTLTETPSDFSSDKSTVTSSGYSLNFGAGVQDQLSEPGFDVFGENSKKEKLILRENRVKLIEYIHDCKVLFPYLKQKSVFSTHECEIIQHEVTGKQRMDKFLDIVLTKGPEAIGVFHESLRKDYPFVFDVLTRLFSSANIDLPPSRQLREDPDASDPPSDLENTLGGVSVCSYSFPRRNTTKHIRATIRRQMDELHQRCEQVKSQRDDLQQALLQRERDINALLNHRDQQIQQKYEDMLTLLAKWRETMTNQSDGSIQKMQELLSEQEGIKEAYEQLEGEYMLVLSELSAARDRIAKLLAHLEKMETEFALAQEQKEALFDKISLQQGEIERMQRRLDRIKKVPSNDDSSSREMEKLPSLTPEQCSKTHNQLAHALDEKQELARMLEVAQKERKQAINDYQSLQLQLYEEKEKRKKLEEQLHKCQQPEVSGVKQYVRHISCPGQFTTYEDVGKVIPLLDETIVMPAHNMGMELGMVVSVRELMEGGNAVKAGVRLGDEISQVNHIKVSSDAESLAFAQRLLQQASSTITLSIKRQGLGNSSPYHSSSSPSPAPHLLPSPAHSSSLFAPLQFISKKPVEVEAGRHGKPRKSASGLPSATGLPVAASLPRKRPPNLIPSGKNFNSVGNLHAAGIRETLRDTSDSTSEDSSREFNDDTFAISSDTEFPGSTHNLSPEEGIITSPTSSVGCRDYFHSRMPIKLLTDDSNSSLPILDSPSEFTGAHRYDSDSTEPRSLEELPAPSRTRPRPAIKRKVKKSQDLPKRLSKSLDDLDIAEDIIRVSSSDITSSRDDLRQVILPFGQLGLGLSIIGGRGNGLFIRSERHNDRSLKTGDQIVKICGKSALKMTYGEAVELMTKYNSRGKESVLTVKTNKEGYSMLHFFSRDNFYVRAKVSHKSRSRLELSFDVGDVFRVTDTKPKEQSAMWQVEKLNSRGHTLSTGYIPMSIDSAMIFAMGSHSLPRLKPSPLYKGGGIDYTLQVKTSGPSSNSTPSTQTAFKIYQPVKELPVTDLRPVVLFGVYENELREALITYNKRPTPKFATPTRVPKEKLVGQEDKLIESFHSKSEGHLQSTIDHVMEVARSGRHCVLNLSPSDLANNSRIGSLHPIIMALDPHHKTMKIKAVGGRVPGGFPQEQIGPSSVQNIKERIRSVRPYVTGEVSVNSPVNVDDLVGQVVDLVAEQQKHTLWELDLP